MFHFAGSGFFALLQVILIDITMAGDNAVVIGMAAARVPKDQRRQVILWGLVAAVTVRVLFASVTMELLAKIGLMLAGGILLLWVAWRLYRDLRHMHDEKLAAEVLDANGMSCALPISDAATRSQVRRAILQIALADLSMSLDNVLAVAGAAMHHYVVLAVGLLLSIGLMGIAASMVARLLHRHPWLSYAGLFIVVYVAINMIVHGSQQVMGAAN